MNVSDVSLSALLWPEVLQIQLRVREEDLLGREVGCPEQFEDVRVFCAC